MYAFWFPSTKALHSDMEGALQETIDDNSSVKLPGDQSEGLGSSGLGLRRVVWVISSLGLQLEVCGASRSMKTDLKHS